MKARKLLLCQDLEEGHSKKGIACAKVLGQDGTWHVGQQGGGPCGCSRVSEEERRREELGAGWAGPCGEDLSFYPREMEALEGCGQRKGWARLRCSQAPSGDCFKEDRWGWGKGRCDCAGPGGRCWDGPRSW